MQQLTTSSEQQALRQAQVDLLGDIDFGEFDKDVLANAVFREAFKAGLSYNQAKLDKLISFIKGEIPRSEVEGLLE